jgi:hypothetical protein
MPEPGEAATRASENGPILIGDAAALKLSTIKDPKFKFMTPRILMGVGWPNHFGVLYKFMKDGEEHLTLAPCCYWMIDKASREVPPLPLCTGHPTRLFERIPQDERERDPKEGDRFSTLVTPWGPLYSLEYLNEDPTPVLTVKIGGHLIVINAGAAKWISEKLKEIGI